MKKFVLLLRRVFLLFLNTFAIVCCVISCTSIPQNPNPTQIQQTLDNAIQQQLTVAVQQATEAASTQEKLSITQTINAAVLATMATPANSTATAAINQAAATNAAATSSVFPELAETAYRNSISSIEIQNNSTNEFVRLDKDSGVWYVATNRNTQKQLGAAPRIRAALLFITALVTLNRFEDNNLNNFGLDNPQFSIILSNQEGKQKILLIGNKAPTSKRYYAILKITTRRFT